MPKITKPPKHTIERSPRRKAKQQQTKGQLRAQHTNTYSRNLQHHKIRMDHQETRYTLLLLGHDGINQV